MGVRNPKVVLVNRHEDADTIFRNDQQNNMGGHNNLATMVKNILAQNDLHIGLHRPNFVSAPGSQSLLKTLVNVEHIAHYLTEVGDITYNENLRMKYFPNSLTKKCLYLVYNILTTFHSQL